MEVHNLAMAKERGFRSHRTLFALSTNVPTSEGPVIAPADDESTDDGASARAVSIASSTTTLASSILQARVENGRTYHKYKDGKYVYPNDERENVRLDLQHNVFLLTTNHKLGLTPPNEKDSGVRRVLDVGTGTGLWAIEFGEEHSEAEVIGVDLSPVETRFVPPNVKYLEPGGWFEIQDGHIDEGTLKSDSTLIQWIDNWDEAAKIAGQVFSHTPDLVKEIEDAGFVDVTLAKYKWPINDWPKHPHHKELGTWARENLLNGLEALTLGPFTRALGWRPEECQILLMNLGKDFNNRNIHAYFPV
ncbi:Secondary metabolism regulator LAE1 [Colletotrichum orbiculare MAFF 240422]|uniref:Secondary metabolism regulator LAE1 n=1 Tax=Colletotrichum orbiculare (strain 104-T / ATCC 96160 / CBS 514.97 / LARS 414 / MAFF 240422) TaxID=1213857 RepID=A0A484FVS0_COLOR|nr:Secondary metabolism regulator LAE1 [Colletotrichum orbiculare MAFF 240422]